METISSYEKFKFVKEIESDTKVRAVHVKVDGTNYHVAVVWIPRGSWTLFAYKANRSGLPLDVQKFLFKERAIASTGKFVAEDEDLQTGTDLLVEMLTQKKEKEEN